MKLEARTILRMVAAALFLALVAPSVADAQAKTKKKPNILVIWGDDIGYWNVSAYNQGMMGYKTPNIDRIAKEGALFTDWYGQQSCTAGRSAFITGQSGFRTGNLKVGLPGAKEGLQARDVTLAQLLKAQGYMTAQFGKNHLGDRDEHLPTAHGFDEFMGSLYHLNAEEEPENPDYFKDPAMIKKYNTRGVIHTWANPDGSQKIESTGPLTVKRMETIDEEITKASLDYLDRAKKADKPFFLWWNSTRMHIFTHLKAASVGKTGLGIYPDGMVEHDAMVGQLLDKLKALGLEDNTIVMYSTDNGAEEMSWPDGGTTPFRGEKATNWEGGYRVPGRHSLARRHQARHRQQRHLRPRRHDPDAHGRRRRARCQGAAAQGHEGRRQDLQGPSRRLQHHRCAGRQRRPTRATSSSISMTTARSSALRYDQWKIVFAEQRAEGFDVWQEPFVQLRIPKIFNLRSDPFEKADHVGFGYSQVAGRPHVPARAGTAVRRRVPGHLQGIPAEPESRQLLARPGAGDAAAGRRQVTPTGVDNVAVHRAASVALAGAALWLLVRMTCPKVQWLGGVAPSNVGFRPAFARRRR